MKADENFMWAIEVLKFYEKRYHSKETVARGMAAVEAMDKYSSTISNKMKENLDVREGFK
jgi:hypothetical protein